LAALSVVAWTALLGGDVAHADTPVSEAEADAENRSFAGLILDPGTEVPVRSDVYSRSHALVIGIDDYAHLPDLRGAVRDAEAVALSLEARDFEVVLLLDDEATKDRIEDTLYGELAKQVGEADRFLIYFAGHGVPQEGVDESMGYLMPVEAKKTWDGIEMVQLQRELRNRIRARHILYMADACYSGLGLSTRAAPVDSELPGYLKHVAEWPVQLQFTAGGAGEQAHEYAGPDGTHGLFTYHLLLGLDGEADRNRDGVITSAELWPYLQEEVSRRAEMEGYRQNPQYGRAGEGEFFFFMPAVDSVAAVSRFPQGSSTTALSRTPDPVNADGPAMNADGPAIVSVEVQRPRKKRALRTAGVVSLLASAGNFAVSAYAYHQYPLTSDLAGAERWIQVNHRTTIAGAALGVSGLFLVTVPW